MLTSRGLSVVVGFMILNLWMNAPAVSQTSPGAAAQPGRASAVESGRKVLDRTLMEITWENSGAPDKPTIFLVGENHGSIKAQKQCAEVIERLLDAGVIEAVLVEGSEGAFNRKPTVDRITELLSAEKKQTAAARYWREQLEQGLIAGYEYVALTRPSIPVFGVEDMEAKCRHELRLHTLTGADVAATIAHWRRGEVLLEATMLDLEGKGIGPDRVGQVKEELAAYRTTIDRLHRTMEGCLEQIEPQLNTLRDSCEWRALIGKHSEFVDWIVQLQELISEPSPSRESRAKRLQENIERYGHDHENELAPLFAILQHPEKAQEKETAERELEKAFKPVQEVHAEVQDAYFIAANQVRALGESHGISCTRLATFFRDEADLLESEYLARTAQEVELQDRDKAMVANALRFMKDKGKKRAVFVVGVAHLESIASKMRAEHVSLVGGALVASHDEVEPWEERAMFARWGTTAPLFGFSDDIPPQSRLKDEGWKREQSAIVEYFRRSSLRPVVDNLAGGGRILKGPKEDTAIYCANDVDALGGRAYERHRSAIAGEHVILLGKVPGGEDRFYVVYDRRRAKGLVSELSRAGDVYVYVYQAVVEGGRQRRFITPRGEQTFEEFLRQPPVGSDGQPARRVVLFGEPDEVEGSGRIESPVWGQILGVGGGGGGDRPPGGGWGMSTEPPDESGSAYIGVYATINPRRAAENRASQDRHEAQYVGAPQFVEEHELSKLIPLFTPRRGDYGQMIFIIAHNTADFRNLLRSKAKWFENKQIGLILCGTTYDETEALKEKLLQEGAIMVWAPGQIITPEQARRLKEEIQKIPRLQRPPSLKDLINRALWNWRHSSPDDPNRRVFDSAKAQVRADTAPSDVTET